MNIEMIEAAAARIAGHVRRTPLLNDPGLDAVAGREVWVKAECLQVTGSLKARGAWAAVSALSDEQRSRGVIAFSSGNHAQGVARAASLMGAPAVIVMPSDAPPVKIEATRGWGAEVVTYDRDGESREAIGERLAAERGLTLVRPYDEPQVIAGQGTTGLEIAEDVPFETGEVYVCCGGGGLTSGIALALKARAPGLAVRPVEPEGFDDVARSLASGAIERNPRQSGSICDAIVTPSPGEVTFPIMRRLCGPGIAVSDEEALRAMRLAARHLRLVLEPGGAVALAAALRGGDGPVVAVASGGNADPAMLARALAA